MKSVHEISGFIAPDGSDIVLYTHERHPVGVCAWCDYVRSRSIAREFVRRLEVAMPDCRNLNMWSLGTSLHDTKFNRKLLRGYWQRFRTVLHKRGHRSIVFRVVEVGRRGFLHVHYVDAAFIPHKDILSLWRSITSENSNVHVSGQKGPQDVKRLTKYLTKYLCKSSTEYRWMGPLYGLGFDRDRSVRSRPRSERLIYGGVTCYRMVTEQSKYYGDDSGVQRSLPSSKGAGGD